MSLIKIMHRGKILFDPKNIFPLCIILISDIFLFFYLLYALRPFYKACFSLLYERSMLLKMGVFFVIVLITHRCFFLYSNGHLTGPHFGVSLPTFMLNVAEDATMFPLVFLVRNIIYFGPIVCFGFFLWKDIIKYAWRKNFGLFLLIGLYVFFSTNGESRQSTNFFPFFVIIVTDILNKKNISFSHAIIFGVISLVTSQVWLPISINPGIYIWHPQFTNHFPVQLVSNIDGTWITPLNYAIDVIIAPLITFSIYRLFFASTRTQIRQQLPAVTAQP